MAASSSQMQTAPGLQVTASMGQCAPLSPACDASQPRNAPSHREHSGALPHWLVVAIVLLHALPLFLFAAALLPESVFTSRSRLTSSMLLLVTLSITTAWLVHAAMLAPLAGVPPMLRGMSQERSGQIPALRRGISQDIEMEFQLWKNATFAVLQTLLILVWVAWWNVAFPTTSRSTVYSGPALVPNLLAIGFITRVFVRRRSAEDLVRLEATLAWMAAVCIPLINTLDFLIAADPASRSEQIDKEERSGRELWLPYMLVGVVLAMQPFSQCGSM